MSVVATVNPYTLYLDTSGKPLDSGFLYFGQAFQDPEQFPIPVFWDENGTIPAQQPIRTVSGYPVRNGSPSVVYAAAQYSLRVLDKDRRQVFYNQNVVAADLSGGGYEVRTAAAGQTVFNLATFTYEPGANALDVHMNGLLLTSGVDYLETDASTVTLVNPAGLNDQLIFQARNVFNATQAGLVDFQSRTFDGAGGPSQNFTLTSNPGSVNNVWVSVAGAVLRPGVDFTLSGNVVTVTPGPAVGVNNVLIRWGRSLPQDALRADLADTTNPANGAALVGFIQTGAGAVARDLYHKGLELLSLADYGVLRDGTDESAKIQNAANELSARGGGVLIYPAGSYRQEGVALPSNVHVWLQPGATVLQAVGADDVFKATGSVGADILLTANASAGATSIQLASTTGIAPNDWLIISDNADYSSDAAALGYKSGESVIVESVDGLTVNLRAPLYGSMLASGQYLTANSAKVVKVSPVRNVAIFGGGEIELLQTSNTNGFTPRYCDGVKMIGVKVKKFAGSGVLPRDSRNVYVSDCDFEDGLDNVGAGFPGYGVCVTGACDVVNVTKNRMSRVRHGFTTIGGATGYPVRVTVEGNQVFFPSFTGIDTHEAGRDIAIRGNSVNGGIGVAAGINARTGMTIIENNDITNVPGTGIAALGTNLSHVTIRNNTLRDISGFGINAPDACAHLSIVDNILENIGNVPITVFGGTRDTTLSPDCLIARNNIANYGTVVADRDGIVVAGSQANDIRIIDNTIDASAGSVTRAINLIAPVTGIVRDNIARGTFSITPFTFSASIANFRNIVQARPREVQFTVADDGVFVLPIISSVNVLVAIGSASAGNANPNMIFRARPNASPQCAAVTAAITNVAFTTGALTGTTGVDGNTTISADNGNIYVENRSGGALTLWLQIFGPTQ
jgi:polygalacturonase